MRHLTESPDIELLDPSSRVARDRWWRFRGDVDAFDLPYDPPLTPPQTAWLLYDEPKTRCETWVTRDGDGIAAGLRLQLFLGHNPHLAWAQLHVRADARRRGLGRALYQHGIEQARADGRRTLNVSGPRSDVASEFADAMGAELSQTLLRTVQRFDDLDLRRIERLAQPPGATAAPYSLVRWLGRCPDDLMDGYVDVKAGMLDAPVSDDLDFEPPRVTADMLHAAADLYERLGIKQYVTCARDDATGALIGTTQVFTVGGMRAEQGDTTVLAAHRGHRLGLRLKAAMVLWLTEAEPGVREIQTWNDPDNEPMLHVNHELGYRPSELWDTWTRPTAA